MPPRRSPPAATLAWGVYRPDGSLLTIMGEAVILTSKAQAQMFTEADASVARVCIAPVQKARKK